MAEKREYTVSIKKKGYPTSVIIATNPQDAVRDYFKLYLTDKQIISIIAPNEQDYSDANVKVVLNGQRKSVSFYRVVADDKPFVRIVISTDVLDVINVDTYHSGLQMQIRDNSWYELTEIITEKAKKYIEEAFKGTNFEYCSKYGYTFKSPQYYNYGGDWIEFTMVLSREEIKRIKKFAKEDAETGKYGFFKWAKSKYVSGSGFVSTMPVEPEKFFKALSEGPNHATYNYEKAVMMVMAWEISKHIPEYESESGSKGYDGMYWDELLEYLYEQTDLLDEEYDEEGFDE